MNPAQIAAAGQSDGGDTVAALVGNTCCLDRKVVAAMVLSGAEVPPPMKLPGTYFQAATLLILFVQGSADTVNPPSASLQMYQADTGTRLLPRSAPSPATSALRQISFDNGQAVTILAEIDSIFCSCFF